ncbi:MAG: hypothetical protein D6722_15825 [Bacteroidetes bacterium]|nr:MAG: hypothetical protein D6722_15825 [Bacteroidota bacterium]
MLNRAFDYRTYLDALAADGMNYTRIFTGVYCEFPGQFGIGHNTLAPEAGDLLAPWARSEVPGYANGGNKFDLSRWDTAYFARLDDFLRLAAERDIIVELTFFTSQYQPGAWARSPLHPANNINGTDAIEGHRVFPTLENGNLLAHQEAMVREIVRAVNAHDNLFFEIQNEPWADQTRLVDILNPSLAWALRDQPQVGGHWNNRVEVATPASLAWQRRVVDWITEEEARLPQQHLIAQNYCNYGYPVAEIDPRVSILNFHYAYPHAAWDNYGQRRVLSFDESGFAGSADSTYRAQAWAFLLAGGGVFNNLDYSFYVGAEDGRGPNDAPGGGGPELRQQLKLLREFLTSFSLWRMQPDRQTFWRVEGARAYLLHDPGQACAVYLHGQGPATLRLDLPAGTWQATWLNPATGDRSQALPIQHPGGELVLATPPFGPDLALGLRRE